MQDYIKENLKTVLKFYKLIGFSNLPFGFDKIENTQSPSDNTKSIIDDILKKLNNGNIAKITAISELRELVGDCKRCKLSKERTNIVFGEGSIDAKIMFIGEAPGREEDKEGRPFVGDAGKTLTNLIEKMGFKRQDVYIGNIAKCRPPQNRDPESDEILTCFPFISAQIKIISPLAIISLGKISTYNLIKETIPITKFSITRTRGKFYEYEGISLMPTFHPAYLNRNPKDKWLTWQDAQSVLEILKLKQSKE